MDEEIRAKLAKAQKLAQDLVQELAQEWAWEQDRDRELACRLARELAWELAQKRELAREQELLPVHKLAQELVQELAEKWAQTREKERDLVLELVGVLEDLRLMFQTAIEVPRPGGFYVTAEASDSTEGSVEGIFIGPAKVLEPVPLELTIEVPDDVPDEELRKIIREAALQADAVHRANGGHGLKIDAVEVFESVRVPGGVK